MSKFHKYKSYQTTEESWLHEIPEHWSIYRLKYIFEITKRIAGELGHDVLSITQQGIKVKDTESGAGQLSMDYSKYQKVDKGDFAMNHMDLLTGYVDISKFDGVISPDYRVFKLSHSECDSQYLLYTLQLCYTNRIFFKHGKGVSMLGRWRLPAENFKNFFIPLPPMEEQFKVASFLNYKLAKIERFITKKRVLLNLNIERRKSFTSKIIKSDTVQFLRLSSVTKFEERQIERNDNDVYTPVGLYNRGRGIFHKEQTFGKDLGDSTFYYIEEGDVVLSGQFAWEGAVALASKSDHKCVASHRYPVLRCDLNIVKPEFLYSYFTISDGFMLLDINSRGAAGRNRPLNPRRLVKEKIPIPSIELQKELVEIYNNEVRLKTTVSNEIKIVEEYKTALIAEAVTGKIDVRNFEIPESTEDENYEDLQDELNLAAEDEAEYRTEEVEE